MWVCRTLQRGHIHKDGQGEIYLGSRDDISINIIYEDLGIIQKVMFMDEHRERHMKEMEDNLGDIYICRVSIH